MTHTPNDQVVAVMQRLRYATLDESVTWRKTDDPDVFQLVRTTGSILIGPTGNGESDDYPYLFVRFRDPDGSVDFEFTESSERTELDEPVHNLWDAIQARHSDLAKTMNAWLQDLPGPGEPF